MSSRVPELLVGCLIASKLARHGRYQGRNINLYQYFLSNLFDRRQSSRNAAQNPGFCSAALALGIYIRTSETELTHSIP